MNRLRINKKQNPYRTVLKYKIKMFYLIDIQKKKQQLDICKMFKKLFNISSKYLWLQKNTTYKIISIFLKEFNDFQIADLILVTRSKLFKIYLQFFPPSFLAVSDETDQNLSK